METNFHFQFFFLMYLIFYYFSEKQDQCKTNCPRQCYREKEYQVTNGFYTTGNTLTGLGDGELEYFGLQVHPLSTKT